MSEKILFVDDEPNVLKAIQRQLRKQFQLVTASSGREGLEVIQQEGPFSVVVADMRMPEMDGIAFLKKVQETAPDSVRLMLTGNADQQTAIDAVNEGNVFRFLNKPCATEILARAIQAGLEQHRLIVAEKELLQKTLVGSIRVLSEVLSLVSPEAFGRTARLLKITRKVVKQMGHPKEWWLEPLVLLSQVGCVILPENVLKKIPKGQAFSTEEYKLYIRHPRIGSDLLAKIPRMEEIARSIRYQEKNFDGTGTPHDEIQGKSIPLGARILKVVLDFERGDAAGLPSAKCLSRLKKQSKWYDPDILAALEMAMVQELPVRSMEVSIHRLEEGMVLADNVFTGNGLLLVSKGHVITPSVHNRLENFRDRGDIKKSVHVVRKGATGPAVNRTV